MKRRIAVVTGASSGIGVATALRLEKGGYKVYGTSRREAEAEAPVPMIALDVTSDESVARAVASVLDREGQIDLLVNNAGFTLAPAGAEEISTAQAKALFETNFFGVVRMTRAVLPSMRRQASGRIVNVSSVLGFLPAPYMAIYSATKHALEGYSASVDHEVRTRGIRVSVVEPAYTATQFGANAVEADSPLADYSAERVDLGRLLARKLAEGDLPQVVAETIYDAAVTPRPRTHYTAGRAAARLHFLRRFAPASLLDAGIRKDFELDGPRRIL